MKKLTAFLTGMTFLLTGMGAFPAAAADYTFVGHVAERYQEDCQSWDAAFFNRELEFEAGEEVIASAVPRENEGGEMVVDVTLNVPDTQTADEWAWKLQLIGWFDSEDITWVPANEDERLDFEGISLSEIKGGTLTAVIKHNHLFDFESYSPAALNQAIGMNCIAGVTRIWNDLATEHDCLFLTLTDATPETAAAAAKALYDLEVFYAVELERADADSDPASLIARHRAAKRHFREGQNVLYSTIRDGDLPAAPESGKIHLSELLQYLTEQYPDDAYAVQFRSSSADTPENLRVLKEYGIQAAPVGEGLLAAVVTAENLTAMLADTPEIGLTAALYDEAPEYYMDTDGVFYSFRGDGCAEEDIPQLGEFRKSPLLQQLLERYPDGVFAVQMESYSDTMTREEIAAWMQAQGFAAQIGGENHWVGAVMTAEEIQSFVQHPHIGFKSGLAAKWDASLPETQPTEPPQSLPRGDVTGDGARDIMDVIWLNKFLLGSVSLTDEQKLAADTTKDGAVSPEDSLLLLRWVVEIETPDA